MPRARPTRSAALIPMPEPMTHRSKVAIVSRPGQPVLDWRLAILGDLLYVVAGAAGRIVWVRAAHAIATTNDRIAFVWRGYLFAVRPGQLAIQVLDPENTQAWEALTTFVEAMDLEAGGTPKYHPATRITVVDEAERLIQVVTTPP